MANVGLRQITKRFGTTTALDHVSLDIADGEFLVLLGPSGCGKSTLLRIMAGLLPVDTGRVTIGDRDVTVLPPGDRNVSLVFQSYALYPHLSVARNMGFSLQVKRTPRHEVQSRVESVAAQLQLSGLLARKPRELSGGQRQRVALGRAMVRNPDVFLMDEPLSNLDAQLRSATRSELSALHQRLGTTFVYVTHDQVEAMTMGTRIVVLDRGHIEQVGTPGQVYDEPASTFVATFVGSPGMNLLPATARSRHGRVHVVAEGVEVPLWVGTLADQPVQLGVRPEDLSVAHPASPGPRIEARVVRVENLGSEEVAWCQVGQVDLAVRGPRPLSLPRSGPVSLTAPEDKFHLFDMTSGRRLTWVPDHDAVPERRTPVVAT